MNRIFFLFLFVTVSSFAQSDFQYSDRVYLPHIKSVQFHHQGLETSQPIIDLNSNGRLMLRFDDILGGDRNYSYKIVHCDKDWNPSDLVEMEYLDGFNDEEIDNYEYSRGTVVDYTNYQLSLPNEDTRWRLSGNYLLIIKDEDSDELAITRRFMVVDPKVSIGAQVTRPIRANRVGSHHEIDLAVNHKNFPIQNPQREIFVTIMQNGRWDHALKNITPRFVTGFDINFDQANQYLFSGSKEFRGVDLRSIRSRGFGVHSIDRYSDGVDVLMELDETRLNRPYFDYDDLDGQYIIESLEDDNFTTECEYVNVYFALSSPRRIPNSDVCVFGALTNWECNSENTLRYDPDRQIYFGSIILKQGYYDYLYVVKNGDDLDYDYFEGSDFATANQYTALVYLRSFGERYDQLIGVTNFQSGIR